MSSNELTQYEGEPQPNRGSVEVAASRQAQEVQAMAVMAKRFPRDEVAATTAITSACKRMKLAEQSMYSYPKGGTMVTGPSIRLAETLARCWGNLDFGIIELEQRLGHSEMMAYCWDVQTNVRETKVFTVKHERHTRKGSTVLDDPRDIYETTANQGARRLRACILGVIPGDVQDLAIEQCTKTLSGSSKEPLEDRIRKMVAAFAEQGVTQEMLENKLSFPIKACNESHLVNLRAIYTSIKDGVSAREDWFELQPATSSSQPGTKTEQMAAEVEKKTKSKKKTEAETPPETSQDRGAEPAYPPSLATYATTLWECTSDSGVRGTFTIHVMNKKEELSEDEYAAGCELRDFHVHRLAPPKQGELLK